MITFAPQPGPQTNFLASSATITFYGGEAGSGKSWGLLLDAMRHYQIPGSHSVIFRRTTPEIIGADGLWPKSEMIYPHFGAQSVSHTWTFPSGAKISMSHLEREKDRLKHQGLGYTRIGFDELTHFTASQFWYLYSRARASTSPIQSRIRGTVNPDPDSFVWPFVAWYIDDHGYPIPERAGVIRYWARKGDEILWGDTPESVMLQGGLHPETFSFIPATLADNPMLTQMDPDYRNKISNLPLVEQLRLGKGNWKVRPSAGQFNRAMIHHIINVPDLTSMVRAWDLAASIPTVARPDPDWTIGALCGKDKDGRMVVQEVRRFRAGIKIVEDEIITCARNDGAATDIALYQDPASAGKSEIDRMQERFRLENLPNKIIIEQACATKGKEVFAKGLFSKAQKNQLVFVNGPWCDATESVLEQFPYGIHDDDVDALALAEKCIRQNIWIV